MQAVFYGVGASVIAIITISAFKLTTKTIGKDWLLGTIFCFSAAMTIVTESEYRYRFSSLLDYLLGLSSHRLVF